MVSMAEERVSRALATAVRTVPAESIPGLINALCSATEVCVSQVFQQLLGIVETQCEELVDDDKVFLSFKSAVLELLRDPGCTIKELDRLVQAVCLPLLMTNSTKGSRLLAEAVAAKASWSYAVDTQVLKCYTVLSREAHQGTCNGGVMLSLTVACQLVTDLLLVAVDAASVDFCRSLVDRFWDPCLKLLSEPLDESLRSMALQFLFPALIKALKLLRSTTGTWCRELNDVWRCCKELFSGTSSQRRDSYSILTILAAFIEDIQPDIREIRFWKELQNGLVDDDPLTRKRALYVLKHALQLIEKPRPQRPQVKSRERGTGSKRERWAEEEAESLGVNSCPLKHSDELQRWSSFILLYEMLDEYGIHLVEAAWKAQIIALTSSSISASNVAERLEFSWILLLFERGFKHGNPQVRRHILQSFFELPWESYKSLMSEDFVLGPLLYVLNDPVHHKDFGINNTYTSETGNSAVRFFQTLREPLDINSRALLIVNIATAFSKLSPCRAGLMTVASCMEAIALGSNKLGFLDYSQGQQLMEALRTILEMSKHHFNPCYRTQVCRDVVNVVYSLARITDTDFVKFSHFLSSFPRDFLASKGPLRNTFEAWLVPTSPAHSFIFDGLQAQLDTFLKSPDTSVHNSFVEDDVEVWREEAERWTRIFFIGLDGSEHQSRLLQRLEHHALEIYRRTYMPVTVPEKVLLLLESLSEWPATESQFVSRLSKLFETVLGELMSYAEKCAVALWEYELDGPMQLPPSLTGRLGGPSQRWLSSQAAFVASKAVLAVETVSKCYYWFSVFDRRAVQDSVGAALWNLSWKLLTVFNHQEAVRGEFQLAGFEALASICKALPFYVESSKGDLDVQSFVEQLLDVFDRIIKEGRLVRSRRSVLARHKWSCLAELLSLGKHKNGAPASVISPSTLSIILQDAMDSLGSAAEDYIVPLFQCVRWLVHWGVAHSQANLNQFAWELVQSGWTCMADCNKRKIAVLATFLSTFFHPNLFSILDMHNGGADSDEVGPLKWLLGKLIELGARSPRTMRLTALHVTGLWLKYPETLVFYKAEMKTMCLYGGEAIDEEFDGEIVENELAAREYATLVQSSDPELQEAFANTDMFVRVAVAVMIDKLAELVERGPSNDYELRISVPAAKHFGCNLLFHLLHAAETDGDLAKELYKKNSAVHRRKIRVWQMMCILSRFVERSAVDEVIRVVQTCLHMNNMPSVRQYIELFAVQLYLRFPDLVNSHLVVLLSDVNLKPQALSSYVYIATNIINFAPPELQGGMLKNLLPAVLPHMTSHHHNLRTFTQVLLFHIFHMRPSSADKLESECMFSLSKYLEENTDCKRLRTCVDQFLFRIDPVAASKPRGLFCHGADDTTKTLDDRPFECVPVAVLDKVSELLNEAREELRESMAADAIALSFGGELTNQQGLNDYQKKISPYKSVTGTDEPVTGNTLKDMEQEDVFLFSAIEQKGRELAKAYEGRQDIIMVASLIERIPNLAGLARTCEVFKASGLAVGSKSILEDRQFKLISVTAEQWVPIMEVGEQSLNYFLERKKREGYTILGLEQTANSVSINEYKFPPKVVLVLGREKDGIPVEVIQTLDACVEIPQLGMIRSLNVHVSGAIALWEYTKQRLA